MRRLFNSHLAAMLLIAGHTSLYGANIPPTPVATATPLEALINQTIQFSGENSTDPDAGPSPLTYDWNFGNGQTSTQMKPTMAFTREGAYRVSLTVSDGQDSGVAFVTVYVLAPVASGRTAKSQPLEISPNGQRLWVANPDSNSVSVLDISGTTPSKLAEIAVCRQPRTLAFRPDGTRVYATCQQANQLAEINPATNAVLRTIPTGHLPYGVAIAPDGRILVSNQGDNSVSVFDAAANTAQSIPVADTPRSIAISHDGLRAYVSHFVTRGTRGQVTEINLNTLSVTRVIGLSEDIGPDTGSSGKGFPNSLSALAVEPSGTYVWVGGIKSNSSRGLFLTGSAIPNVNRVRGFFSPITMTNGQEGSRRVDVDDADSVSAIAYSPNGRYVYVTHQGADTLSVYDVPATFLITPGNSTSLPFTARLDVGQAPQGIVLSANGQRAYVSNFMSRDITVLDLTDPRVPIVTATIPVTPEPLTANVANGKRLFYKSRSPRHSFENYTACTSCHFDGGGHDGRTWDVTQFGEGLRNTIDLRGRAGTGHGPIHWSANFDEGQDFENDIVNVFGGTGLAGGIPNPPLGPPNAGRSQDLDDLAAYLNSLVDTPKSPYRNANGTLSAAALRGRAVFFDPATRCTQCHVPTKYTDSILTPTPAGFVMHDVGTLTAGSGKRLGAPLTGLDTPTLIGVWATAPYLHDGSAATLQDVLTTKNSNDQHGTTSGLTLTQMADLVEYLNSIDGQSDGTGNLPPSAPRNLRFR